MNVWFLVLLFMEEIQLELLRRENQTLRLYIAQLVSILHTGKSHTLAHRLAEGILHPTGLRETKNVLVGYDVGCEVGDAVVRLGGSVYFDEDDVVGIEKEYDEMEKEKVGSGMWVLDENGVDVRGLTRAQRLIIFAYTYELYESDGDGDDVMKMEGNAVGREVMVVDDINTKNANTQQKSKPFQIYSVLSRLLRGEKVCDKEQASDVRCVYDYGYWLYHTLNDAMVAMVCEGGYRGIRLPVAEVCVCVLMGWVVLVE